MPMSGAFLLVVNVGLTRRETLAGCLLPLSQNHPPGSQTPVDTGR